jgi:phospholipid/cholesterol/gamma-HCH transport system substrate-binding protein
MMTKIVRWQLIVFVVIGVVAIVYVGATYAKLDRLVGVGSYTVKAEFPDSGGIFTNAEVTYQGVPVGRVGALSLEPDGVQVELILDSDGADIPDSAVAVVANRSAIGEQYVDLRPKNNDGPYLKNGSVITDTKTPPPLQDVLKSAVDFTGSIPVDDLRTVVTELGKAFNGNAENLRSLVDSLSNLSQAGLDNLPQTISLIQNSDVVLGTQAEQSDEILSWSRNLELVTQTLQASDPAIRRLLTTGTTSATQISRLLQDSGGDITTVVRNLAEDVRTVSPTFFAVSPALALLSALSSGSYSPAPGDGTIHFGIVLEVNNPPACTLGYQSTEDIIAEEKRKNPDFDINYDDFPFNTDAKCTVAQGNPTDVRGAARAVYSNPNIAQPWDDNPKKMPDTLNLNPIAEQIAGLLGVRDK